ncbi:MAG TPA: hypothetical protein PLJ78_14305 [Anaerolineae bacterium]|nr:hypothetical protein [Anaerolineae bacterium]HQK15104.1 hypothetical protein [Anaerolineae bacterium]
MSGDMPDWLSALMPTLDEEPLQKAAPEEKKEEAGPMPVAGQTTLRATPAAPAPTPEPRDAMDDLRSQVAVQTEPQATPKKSRSSRTFGGLLPWQVFFLSVLLFLDVAIIGMLFLVMLERVVLP